MKKFFVLLMLIFPVAGFAIDVGDSAPDFNVVALNGKKIAYSSIKDKKPVYLIFWATW